MRQKGFFTGLNVRKISIFYIISIIVFVLSFFVFLKMITDAEENLKTSLDIPKSEILISKTSHLIKSHDGGKQLQHTAIKHTIDYVISSFQNLKTINKENLADLVIETMIVETLVGKSKYDHASRNYKNYGIVQLREDTAEWMLKKLENKDIDTYAEIMAFYNYDKTLRENLLFNVQFGIAMCAQYYYMRDKNLSNNIKTLSSRSHQWKKNYNTYKGLGTPEIYQSRVNEYYKKHIL